MMKSWQKLALMVLALPLTQAALASDFRLGYVNTERIYREAKIAIDAQTRLDKEFATQRTELKTMNAQAADLAKRLESMRQDDPKRRHAEREWAQLDREIAAKSRALREDLNLRRNEEFAAVRNRANQVIKKLAADAQFDLIVQEAVFIHPKHDITDQVLKTLNH